jgi:hypothetical protein
VTATNIEHRRNNIQGAIAPEARVSPKLPKLAFGNLFAQVSLLRRERRRALWLAKLGALSHYNVPSSTC